MNAAGLWARKVGRMVGVDHPLTPMVHHYLVTDDVPEVAAIEGDMAAVTDLEGFTYLQREGNGVLLGVYEQNPRHWAVEGAPGTSADELFPEELDRIMPELSIGFARFPVLQEVGISRWVNGAFTFTPDGNPLVGPVAGLPGYWAACGCMAGFSQGAAIGLAVANWIVDGDPGDDVFGMDVARFGAFACDDAYLRDTTAQFYARRFVIAYPNEQLPAGRPLATTPCYEAFREAGARVRRELGPRGPGRASHPDAPASRRRRRSGDRTRSICRRRVEAVRTAAGAYEIAQYARYEVEGRDAEAWLDHLVAGRLPEVGRIRLTPMLNEAGRLMGDLPSPVSVDDRFWLTGSYYLQDWHLRWFRQHLPGGGVEVRNLTRDRMGFSVSGPASRADPGGAHRRGRLERRVRLPPCAVRCDVGSLDAVVGRISLTGELGYEIVVEAADELTLWRALERSGGAARHAADRRLRDRQPPPGEGLRDLERGVHPGVHAGDVGARPVHRVGEGWVHRSGGRAPGARGRLDPGLAVLEVDAVDAEAAADDPIWLDDRLAGFVTSGAYGHHVGKSLALAYVDRDDRRIARAHGACRRRRANRADPGRTPVRSARRQASRYRVALGLADPSASAARLRPWASRR